MHKILFDILITRRKLALAEELRYQKAQRVVRSFLREELAPELLVFRGDQIREVYNLKNDWILQ
jgi:hypothetical protein